MKILQTLALALVAWSLLQAVLAVGCTGPLANKTVIHLAHHDGLPFSIAVAATLNAQPILLLVILGLDVLNRYREGANLPFFVLAYVLPTVVGVLIGRGLRLLLHEAAPAPTTPPNPQFPHHAQQPLRTFARRFTRHDDRRDASDHPDARW